MASFQAGGTLVLSYTNGTDRWEARIPLAQFDPTTFAYTGAGLKAPLESDVGQTFAAFGSYWAAYFDSAWALSIEAVFWTNAGTATRLATVPTTATVQGTSSTPASTTPPLQRAFRFDLDHGGRHVVRLFGVASDTMGPRNSVTATSGGFDARDQALVGYLAGPGTGLVAWDGQVFPPIATVYQRYKLRPFERAGPAPAPGPPGPAGPPGTPEVDSSGTRGQAGQVLQTTADGTGTTWADPCCEQGPTLGLPGGSSTSAGWTAGQYLCGAADAMAEQLSSWYRAVEWALNALVAIGAGIALDSIIAAILAAIGVSETGIPAWVSIPFLAGLAKWLLGVLATGTIPNLDRDQVDQVIRDLYCVLPHGTTTVSVTSGILSAWADELAAHPGPLDPVQIDLLSRLLRVPLPVKWQGIAAEGALTPTRLCDDWVCGGAAMSGGAFLGPAVLHAMSGGASYVTASAGSISGGAALRNMGGHALSGGASLA